MTSEVSERIGTTGHLLSPTSSTLRPYSSGLVDESETIELSPSLREDLLNFDAWGGILAAYGRTMRVAVALTDPQGQILGECHNPQPVWKVIHEARCGFHSGCPFCITTKPCTAVSDALITGGAIMVHDQAGLTHVAVPLLLGKEHLGAIVAGQVFDQYPDALLLERVAKQFKVPPQELWNVARMQRPVGSAILKASGDLLCALGRAFLRERYGAILEAKLAQTNGRFRLLVDGVKDHALFTMDSSGLVTSWNDGAENMLGYPESEIMGRSFSCIFTQQDSQNGVPQRQLQMALEKGRTEDEGWRVRRDKNQFWASVNITALWENAHTMGSFAIIVQDKTEKNKIAIVLEEARQERVSLQQRLLSRVSHELRTPLTAIYLFTTNLLDGLFGVLTRPQYEHLTLALDNIGQLKSMVSDLLDVTRVQTYKLSVEPEHISPVRVITEVLGTCRRNAELKNVELRSDIALDLPFLWADPARVRQILTNLIDNGIKFTPKNGTVTIGSWPFSEDSGFLCLFVSDTGCGISPENLDVIFDRLMQVESNTGSSRSGLGLGLYIAKELVSRHDGRIWAESELGKGSTFYFTLPVFSLARLCAPVFAAPELTGGSVTLIAVDVLPVEEGLQGQILPEVRKVLESCIRPGQDVLLPLMKEAQPSEMFFILAWTDAGGCAVITTRISKSLQRFDNNSKLNPEISSTNMLVGPGDSREAQIREVTTLVDREVQKHILAKGKLK
ncbi:MAG: hypothetical protein QOD84_1331 [Acidobacteriaceae bacterium]|jgi:PAS domain S-box-containing protein